MKHQLKTGQKILLSLPDIESIPKGVQEWLKQADIEVLADDFLSPTEALQKSKGQNVMESMHHDWLQKQGEWLQSNHGLLSVLAMSKLNASKGSLGSNPATYAEVDGEIWKLQVSDFGIITLATPHRTYLCGEEGMWGIVSQEASGIDFDFLMDKIESAEWK